MSTITQTQEFQPRTCSKCQQSNAALALFCVHCGSPLSASDDNPMVMAEVLAERLKAIAHDVHTLYENQLLAGALVLYIPAEDAAIVLQHTGKLVLGRAGNTPDPNQYDLTPYNAYTLGVSRRHATITYTSQGYAITDMGSANGTWANARRLLPNGPHYLANTDQIWLGQLILLAYVLSSNE